MGGQTNGWERECIDGCRRSMTSFVRPSRKEKKSMTKALPPNRCHLIQVMSRSEVCETWHYRGTDINHVTPSLRPSVHTYQYKRSEQLLLLLLLFWLLVSYASGV